MISMLLVRAIAVSYTHLLSDKGVKGTVRMELFNPETEKVFYSQKQKFDVKGGETGHVNFKMCIRDRSMHTPRGCG